MSEKAAPRYDGFYPGRAPIDSYGNGGFRFAGMSHRGSLLLLPGGIKAWPVTRPDEVGFETLAPLIAEKAEIEIFLYGSGATQVFPPKALKEGLAERGLFIETMTTGAACRTYNLLLGEGRAVAAALLRID
ncbi:MAG: MTH938/NDUFAF3 family protein [Hyphomicrobiaceae bacterium]